MTENPYKAPQGEGPSPRLTSPPGRLLQAYRYSSGVAIFGAGTYFVFPGFFLPPCGCGLAMMPSWEARLIVLSVLVLVPLVSVSSVVALTFACILWLKYRTRCPGGIVILVALFLVVAMTLPLLG